MAHVERREWSTKAGQRRSAYRVVWTDPATGRRRRKDGFPTRADADRYRRRLEVAILDGEIADDAGRTVAEWMAEWLDEWAVTPTRKHGRPPGPNTVQLKRQQVERHLTPYLGRLPIAQFTRAQAGAWWSGLTRVSPPVPPRTRTQVLHTVRAAMKAAVVRGVISRDPTEGLQAPTAPASEANARAANLDAGTAEAIIAALPEWARGPARMMRALGLRTGEALAMDWGDVACHEDGEAVVMTHLTVSASARYVDGEGSPTRATTKTHRARILPLSEPAAGELEREWEAQGRPRTGLCWPAAMSGGLIAPRTFRRAWRSAVERAGAPEGTRPYDLRHVVATTLIAAGVPAPDAAAFLGHSPRVLLGTYAKPTPRGEDAILGALGARRDVDDER